MELSHSVDIPFPKQTVWDGLNDPNVLRDCIPGCESFEAPQPDHFEVVSVLRIGMIKARFEGAVDLADIDAPNSYLITGSGKGGVAGYASGEAKVRLEEIEAGTRLHYEAQAKVGGKIAQLGSRLIDTVARQMADQFFQAFAQALAKNESGATNPVEKAAMDLPTAATVASSSEVKPGRPSHAGRVPEAGRYDWTLPYSVGLASGLLIGVFATIALG